MKLDKIFVTLFVGLAMTACSNDEEATTGGNQLPVDGKAAYMSLSLAMPKSSGTRAPGRIMERQMNKRLTSYILHCLMHRIFAWKQKL